MNERWNHHQLFDSVLEARDRIKDHVKNTSLEHSQALSELGNANVYLKLENEQDTGSFKCRGAFNKILNCASENPDFVTKGITLASSGNHALGCLMASKAVGCKAKIFLSTVVASYKLEKLTKNGGVLYHHGIDCVESEIEARRTAQQEGLTYVSPYNDLLVVAGQGTIGVELLEVLPNLDSVFMSVGGGGLVSGVGAYLKYVKPSIKVIGVQAYHSKAMHQAVRAGQIVDSEELDTFSDGTAGNLEVDCITFDICRQVVDDWVLCTEEEIAYGVYFMLEKHKKVVEGAAGLAIAGYLKMKDNLAGQNVAIVICGSSIGMSSLKKILNMFA